MRILNRPMFRYGGPIKEGVMHGMRNGGRAALVGNPVYPQTGGREHHATSKVLQYGSQALPWFARQWGKIKPTIPQVPGPKGKALVPAGQDIGRLTPTVGMPFLSNKAKYLKSWVKENPWWTAGGALYGGKPLYETGKATIPAVVKQAADLAVPDWIWDQDKWEKERKLKKQLEEGELSTDQKEIEKLKKLLLDKKTSTDEVIDPDAAAKLAKTQQGERLQSYLDIMGYDSAKKGAMSKALIDASALVQDATTEAGSLKKADWSNLINKAIQTTSKRLDKPEQIREAVGLMMTKSAIEKDLEDPSIKKLRLLQIDKAKKELKGLSIGELIPGISKGLGKTRVDAEVMKNVMSVKEPDIIATIVGKKEDLQDIKDLKDFTTVEDFIVKKYKGKEGIYIIDNVVVQIDATGEADRLY